MAKEVKPSLTLKMKGHDVKQTFGEEQALRLLRLPKSAWELADEKYQFNGVELTKK